MKTYKILRDCMFDGGIKGRVFYGLVGGKKRQYTPIKIRLLNVEVKLLGDDIPKKTMKKRNNPTSAESFFGYDYSLPLGGHLLDLFVGTLEEKTLQK